MVSATGIVIGSVSNFNCDHKCNHFCFLPVIWYLYLAIWWEHWLYVFSLCMHVLIGLWKAQRQLKVTLEIKFMCSLAAFLPVMLLNVCWLQYFLILTRSQQMVTAGKYSKQREGRNSVHEKILRLMGLAQKIACYKVLGSHSLVI